jgi:ATP-dependent helicase/nuclease subunit A
MNESPRPPDAAARERALDAARSFIVQAPAGSGKTELLIQRFLALLARVDAPEEILAITFTIKAAGEMRARVVQALRTARTGEKPASAHAARTRELAVAVLARDAHRAWALEENPGRLRIQTIDALCAQLTRQMPLLSRLGAEPRFEDEPEELYREAALETLGLLEEPQWSEAVARLLQHLNNDALLAAQLVARLLARRDQWLRHVHRLDREVLELALANLVRDTLAMAVERIPADSIADLVFCLGYAAGNLASRGSDSPIVQCRTLSALPGSGIEHLAAWKGVACLLLNDKGELREATNVNIGFPAPSGAGAGKAERLRRGEAKARFTMLAERLAAAPEFLAALLEVRLLPAPAYDESQWRLIDALLQLLPPALAQLRVVFQMRGCIDFPELLLGAIQALGEPDDPTDLALALDYRVQHLLIDEFQDTSLSQYELLHRLTAGWQAGDGRTVFAVGDPMQSIYRFREAEVGLFLRARHEGIGPVALEPLALVANFRSQPAVVDWVNSVFPLVLPAREDIGRGAVAYSPSQAASAKTGGAGVRMHALLGRDRAGEAQQVATLAASAVADERNGTTAILVRSRSHLARIVPELKQAGLRFRAIEIEDLAHRPAVMDAFALTRALVHPADRAAWLSVLRAPWCGLSMADLEALTADAWLQSATPEASAPAEGFERRAWSERAIQQSMNDPGVVSRLSADGQARLARVAAALTPALDNRARGSLRRRVESAWLRLGGPACARDATDLQDVDVFFDLLDALDRGGDLEDLGELAQRMTSLFALPDVQASDRLQLMTIHKAKGLEFDTVIVPGLGDKPRRDDPQLMLWLERPRSDDASDLLLAAMTQPLAQHNDPIYEYVARLQGERQRNEDGRLLYVAATRARRRLELFGHVTLDERAATPRLRSPHKGALLERLWPAVKGQFDAEVAALPPGRRIEQLSLPFAAPLATLVRLRRDWSAPAPPAPVEWGVRETTQAEPGEAEVVFSWAGESARHVGTVVHCFLQRIAEEGLDAWSSARVAQFEPLFRRLLIREGVPDARLQECVQRVRGALDAVLADPRGRWLLGGLQREARSEWRLSGEVEGAFVSVALDRTFVDDEGIRWVVDYKTGIHEGADLPAFLDSERERYRGQLERYAALVRRMEDRPIRLALYFPLLKGWREWRWNETDGGGSA